MSAALEAPAAFFQRPKPGKSGAESMQETAYRAGILREVITTDDTGRRIRRFFGDPEACWGPFKQIPRHITGWNTKF